MHVDYLNGGRVTLKIIFQLACRVKGGPSRPPPEKTYFCIHAELEILAIVGVSYLVQACKFSGKSRAFYGHSGQFNLLAMLRFKYFMF